MNYFIFFLQWLVDKGYIPYNAIITQAELPSKEVESQPSTHSKVTTYVAAAGLELGKVGSHIISNES